MDIIFLGQSAFKLKGKSAAVITDPYESSPDSKFPKAEAAVITLSSKTFKSSVVKQIGGVPLILNGPGEYEVKEVKIVGIASFADNKHGKERGKNIIYSIAVDGLHICHLGNLGQEQLSAEQMEAIGEVDILLIPTGGVDTIDASVAAKISAELEPKVVIPMHFDSGDGVKLESVDKFIKEMGSEKTTPQPKFSVKKDRLQAELSVVLLEKAK